MGAQAREERIAELLEPVLAEVGLVLEVTSPGVDRPLTQPRHWRRSRGRLVTASLVEGGQVTGRVTETDDEGVTLDVEGRPRTFTHAELGKGKVQVEFRREADTDAAD
jgi:ribosome maturation factor RimP